MINKENNPSVAANAVLSFIKTVTGIIFPIVTFAYASRILGVDGIGRVTYSRNLITYFTTIATFGVNYYGTREVAKRRDNNQQLSRFCHEMLMINGVGMIVAYTLLFLALHFISKFKDYSLLLVVNSISIFLTCIGMDWLYQGLEKFKYITLRTIGFQIIAIIVMLIFVKKKDDVLAYTIVLILSSSGAYVFNFLHSRKHISYSVLKPYCMSQHFKPMLWLFAFAVSVELYTVLDSTMLGLMKGDSAVGLYTVAVKTNKMTDTLVTSLGVAMIPRLAYYLSHNAEKESRELINKAYNCIFMFSIPLFFGVFTLAREIILIFSGESFLEATTTMRALAPIIIIIPFNVLTNIQIFIPMGKEKLVLLSSVVAAMTNLIVNSMLIPVLSQNGAAIGTVLSEAACACMCFVFARKYIGLGGVFRLNYQYWVSAVPIVIIGSIVDFYVGGIVLKIVLTVIFSAAMYACCLELFKNPYYLYLKNFIMRKIMSRI